jgi:DNA-binding MarR family transcriptional regulator
MTRWLDDDQQRTWRAWIDVNAKLSARLGRELQASSGLSLADYEVLVALTDVPDHRLRMYELTDALQWEKSRLSKQISRMAARGLVVRSDCPEDRRGAHVALTPEGLAAIEAAAPDHVELVQRLFFDGLDHEQVRALGSFCTTILGRLDDADD